MHIDRYKIADGGYRCEDGIYYESATEFIQSSVLGHCMCGDIEASLEYLRSILRQISGEKKEFEFYSEGERSTIYYMLEKYGLTEHGVCIPGWLTEKGRELLEDLNELCGWGGGVK